MTHHPQTMLHAYSVSVEFQSGGITYGQERYEIAAADEYHAERIAREQAQQSVYFDERIPDLGLQVAVEPADPDDGPDDDPGAPPAALIPTCPKCGSEDVAKDACAQWDEASGAWVLSGTYDCETCLTCGAEGDDMLVWAPPGPPGDTAGARSSEMVPPR